VCGIVLAKIEDLILSTLESSNEGFTLAEIAEKVGESEKKVFKVLRKLFEKGLVDSGARRYRLSHR
jgi:DNA-binding IclR family transcriptional regulator